MEFFWNWYTPTEITPESCLEIARTLRGHRPLRPPRRSSESDTGGKQTLAPWAPPSSSPPAAAGGRCRLWLRGWRWRWGASSRARVCCVVLRAWVCSWAQVGLGRPHDHGRWRRRRTRPCRVWKQGSWGAADLTSVQQNPPTAGSGRCPLWPAARPWSILAALPRSTSRQRTS
jgi:hypothetical protein